MHLAENGIIPPKEWEHKARLLANKGIIPPP